MTAAEIYSTALILLTALAAGLVGSFTLMKRMSLAGDVVSHIALPGLGLALLLGFNPLIGAAVALFLGTLLIWHLQKISTLTTEVAIGVIFTAALAIGTVLTPSDDLIEALFGGFQSLNAIWFVGGLVAVSIIVGFRAGLPSPIDPVVVLARAGGSYRHQRLSFESLFPAYLQSYGAAGRAIPRRVAGRRFDHCAGGNRQTIDAHADRFPVHLVARECLVGRALASRLVASIRTSLSATSL